MTSERKRQIYFIQRADGLIKIGYSSNLASRLDQIRKSHGDVVVLKVINGDQRREREIHYQFDQHREYGEWFRPDTAVVDAINAIHDGSQITFRKSQSRKTWEEYERSIAADVLANAKRLYSLFYVPGRDNQESTIARICDRHGIPVWPFKHLLSGRCDKPTAALSDRIRSAIKAEHEQRIEQLKLELASLAAVDDSPEADLLGEIDALKEKHVQIRTNLQ